MKIGVVKTIICMCSALNCMCVCRPVGVDFSLFFGFAMWVMCRISHNHK